MLYTVIWLVMIALMLLIEIFTMGLTTIWFAIGAMAAAVTAAAGGPVWLQILLFCAVSILVMIPVRPLAKKVFNKNRTKTNIESVVGERAVVTETIDNTEEKGTVRFRGVEWMARSEDGAVIAKDETVIVQSVSGVKLIVIRNEK